MRCKVGDLAFFSKAKNGENIGKIVEVLRYLGSEPEWDGFRWCHGAGPCWLVRSIGAPIKDGDGVGWDFVPAPDGYLRPIHPDADPESITTDEVLEVGA